MKGHWNDTIKFDFRWTYFTVNMKITKEFSYTVSLWSSEQVMRGLCNAPKICVYGKNYVDNMNFIPNSFAAISLYIENFCIIEISSIKYTHMYWATEHRDIKIYVSHTKHVISHCILLSCCPMSTVFRLMQGRMHTESKGSCW